MLHGKRGHVAAAAAVAVWASTALGTSVVLEDGESYNPASTYSYSGDAYGTTQYSGSPNGSSYLVHTYSMFGFGYSWFTKRSDYVPTNMGSYANARLTMYMGSTDDLPSSTTTFQFRIQGDADPGAGTNLQTIWFGVRPRGLGWRGGEWHALDVKVQDGRFTASTSTIDGGAAPTDGTRFFTNDAGLSNAQLASLWSNVNNWSIYTTNELAFAGVAIDQIMLTSLPTPGDTSPFDGIVNLTDLNNVLNNFGSTGLSNGTLVGDTYVFDGTVNLTDLNGVLNNFGASSAPTAAPEPAGLACLAAGGLVGAAAPASPMMPPLAGHR